MHRALSSVWWFFGSTVLAGVVLRWWLGDRVFVTRYAGYVMPWLLLGLVPGAAWAWVKRRTMLTSLLGASTAIIVAVHAPLFRWHPRIAPSSALTVKVMSFNTWSRNADASRIASVILRERPDILLLQEIRPEIFARLGAALAGLYDGAPVHRVYAPELLQGIVTRYPVQSSASLEEKGNAQKAVLRTPCGPISVLNVHPLRYGGWRGRYSQISALLDEDVLVERRPIILGGDLNAPDRSQLYGLLSRALVSAHGERGFGFGFTYPAHVASPVGVIPALPVVRIDHIFCSRHFVVARAGTIEDSGGSDHRPVVAELALSAMARDEAAPADPEQRPVTGPPLSPHARGDVSAPAGRRRRRRRAP